jgi:hypothetical protein
MGAVDPALHAVARGMLALVLLRAAWHKARDLRGFQVALDDYALLPGSWTPAVALGLVAAEVALAAFLLVPATAAAGGLAAAVLLVLYSGAMAVNLLRGRRWIDCGCGGAMAGRVVGEALLVRNAGLVLVAFVAAAPISARSLSGVDALTIAFGGGAAILLYVATDLALAQSARGRALRRPS